MEKIINNMKYNLLKLFLPKGVRVKPKNQSSLTSFYDLKMKANNGKEIHFSDFKEKKVLLVNVASKCGFTPQYKELEALHQQFKDRLVILGFPADNFGGQEPGKDEEIAEFCEINFGVTFPLLTKSSVIGEDQNEVFHWLTHKEENGWNEHPPTWNFCKYLINEKGELIKTLSSPVSPLSNEIVKEL